MQTVNTAEMARRLDTTPEKIREMVHSGDIPYVPVGRLFKFVPENVIDALERKAATSPAIAQTPRSRAARRTVF